MIMVSLEHYDLLCLRLKQFDRNGMMFSKEAIELDAEIVELELQLPDEYANHSSSSSK